MKRALITFVRLWRTTVFLSLFPTNNPCKLMTFHQKLSFLTTTSFCTSFFSFYRFCLFVFCLFFLFCFFFCLWIIVFTLDCSACISGSVSLLISNLKSLSFKIYYLFTGENSNFFLVVYELRCFVTVQQFVFLNPLVPIFSSLCRYTSYSCELTA